MDYNKIATCKLSEDLKEESVGKVTSSSEMSHLQPSRPQQSQLMVRVALESFAQKYLR